MVKAHLVCLRPLMIVGAMGLACALGACAGSALALPAQESTASGTSELRGSTTMSHSQVAAQVGSQGTPSQEVAKARDVKAQEAKAREAKAQDAGAQDAPIVIGNAKLSWHAQLGENDLTIIDERLGLIDIATSAGVPAGRELELVLHEGDAALGNVPLNALARASLRAAGEGTAFEGQPTTRYVGRVLLGRSIGGKKGSSLSASLVMSDLERTERNQSVVATRPLATVKQGAATAPLVPTWALGATWYQIFPERFRNALQSNDPQGPAVFLAEWRSDWYSVQPGELAAWQARRKIDKSTFRPHPQGELFNVIWDRRYGGDLQGVQEKLAYMRELGITAIYFNPIFEAQSLHKYDASDFRHIDQRLANPKGVQTPAQDGKYVPVQNADNQTQTMDMKTWAWTPADRWFVDEFLPACKKAGLRVILDGVWNHTGREFWAFQDIVKNGKKSPYADWYICDFDADGKLVGWSGWDGKNGHLPEFRQVKGGLARDRDVTVEKGDLNAGIKQHIFDVTSRWMDPNGDGDPSDGIDGWRLDVAGEVGQEFWRDWRAHVKKINPQAITIAEIWSDASEWIDGGSFDTQMHYPFAFPVLDWLRNMTPEKKPFGSAQLSSALQKAFKDAPHTNLLHQNLFASHDTDRYVNILWNPGRGYDRDCAEQNGDHKPREKDASYVPYKPAKPGDDIYKLSILGVAIQATYEGSPMIYYGDEIGMWGSDDPTCRKPYPWSDAPALVKGIPAKSDEAPMPWVFESYRSWLGMRSQSGALANVLKYGSVEHLATPSDDVFAFVRVLNTQRVTVIVNRGSKAFDAAVLGLQGSVESVSAAVWDGAARVK